MSQVTGGQECRPLWRTLVDLHWDYGCCRVGVDGGCDGGCGGGDDGCGTQWFHLVPLANLDQFWKVLFF